MRRIATTVAVLLSLATAAWAQVTDPVVEYYHLDGLGSVRAVTNDQRALVRQHVYHPFGHSDGVPSGTDPMRFTGKERDSETGLDYFGARFYASRTGRFTGVDPLMDLADNLFHPQRWNRYAYVANNPMRYVDPDGRSIWTKLIKLVVKGGDVAATVKDTVDDVTTVFDESASTSERIWAGALAGSEALPVSGRDLSMAGTFVAGIIQKGQWHHIATDKSIVSGWTAAFKKLFDKAGMSLQDKANLVYLPGHKGRHAKKYHEYVFDTLSEATSGLRGHQYAQALKQALDKLRKELLQNPDITKGRHPE